MKHLWYSYEQVQSTTGKKNVKYIFQTKKDFITFSKMIINKLGRCPTRSENVYFANNEQASLSVFNAGFCFEHVKYNLIKLKLLNNWSAQAVNNISVCPMWNSSKPIKSAHHLKLANQSTLKKAHVIEITKACTVTFLWKQELPWLFDVEKNVSIGKKTEDGENLFFKALTNRFWLTSKSYS